MNEHTDPLEDVLGRSPTEMPDVLRARVLERAAPVLRRRRVVRETIRTVAAMIVGSLATLALLRSSATQPSGPHEPIARAPGPGVVAPQEERKQISVAKSSAPAVSPEEFEWQAFDAPESERAHRYFDAGDRYLRETNDLDAAMRCYRFAFRYATPAERRIRPTDSWLVATLKSETFPEDRR
jgi:hypothetical protein